MFRYFPASLNVCSVFYLLGFSARAVAFRLDCLLGGLQSTLVYLREQSALTIVHAATLRSFRSNLLSQSGYGHGANQSQR